MFKKIVSFYFFIFFLCFTQTSFAQNQKTPLQTDTQNMTKDEQIQKLARETSSPVTSLWMLTIKEIVDMHEITNGLGKGPYSAQSNTELYPIMHFSINDKWGFLLRFVVPILGYQDSYYKGNADKHGSSGGLGNIGWTLMMTPRAHSPLIIGFGVSGQFPTATPEEMRNTDWTLGPAMVLGVKTKPFMLATLISYTVPLYSAGGQYKPVADIQLIWNISLPHGWGIGDTDLHYTYDQSKPANDRWTAPIGIGFSKLFLAGKLPLRVGFTYNIDLAKHNESKYNNSIILSFTAVVPSLIG